MSKIQIDEKDFNVLQEALKSIKIKEVTKDKPRLYLYTSSNSLYIAYGKHILCCAYNNTLVIRGDLCKLEVRNAIINQEFELDNSVVVFGGSAFRLTKDFSDNSVILSENGQFIYHLTNNRSFTSADTKYFKTYDNGQIVTN